MHPEFSLRAEDFWKGFLVFIMFTPARKMGEGLVKVTKLLLANRFETQMSTPGPASEPCLVESYLWGGENGKIVFWKACLSL